MIKALGKLYVNPGGNNVGYSNQYPSSDWAMQFMVEKVLLYMLKIYSHYVMKITVCIMDLTTNLPISSILLLLVMNGVV